MYQALVTEYEKNVFNELVSVRRDLDLKLNNLIQDSGVLIQSISGRLKDSASLSKKLARPDRSYKNLFEVTDLLAFRVITYSEDMIPVVARLIEQFFEVDYNNSTNKLINEDVQKFGYRSLHYVCHLPKELQSSNLPKPFRFEIQIRTILQHTWAEIEHDIGYKSSEQLPRDLRRRFSQVASLLEIADREFAAIRTDLKSYQDRLIRYKDSHSDVEVDRISLHTLLLKNEQVQAWDADLAQYLSVPLDDKAFYPDYLVKALQAAGLIFINQIFARASVLKPKLIAFLPIYFEFADQQWGFKSASVQRVKSGYGLLFLAHLHILESEELYINKVE